MSWLYIVMDLQLYSQLFSLLNYRCINTAHSELTLKRTDVIRKIPTLIQQKNNPALVYPP